MNEFTKLPLIVMVNKYAQKTQLWFFMLTAFCAMRAANGFTVALAYTIVVFRILQTIGHILQNKFFSEFTFGIITFLLFLMFFNEFANESADIVHETEPTDDVKFDLNLMKKNYNPLNLL